MCNISVVAQQDKYPFKFTDVAAKVGLLPAVAGIYGHGAAWGDTDGDGWLDIYVGTFDKGGKRNMLFRNNNGRFTADLQKSVSLSARPTGMVFADLDNDGDADLYVGSMPQQENHVTGNTLFENTGKGIFRNISQNNGACPIAFGGRSVAILDFDGDGLLDILAGEDPVTGYNGSATQSSRLFRNRGNLQFEDVSAAIGLPDGTPGLGVAAADVNNDGWPDIFLASNNGGNRLFLNNNGKFTEAPGTRELFQWPGSGGDNMVCGISFGDINVDGLTDILLGPHFEEPWIYPQALRLFINKGIKTGNPLYEEATIAAGLRPIPMKAPHVEIQDFDNDGRPDIYTSVVKFSNGNAYPMIFRQTTLGNGALKFSDAALQVNDFPAASDKSLAGNKAQFFTKMLKEKKIIYSASGPAGDFDNDGKLDMFLPAWWPEAPSMLLHNETTGGNFLMVKIQGSGKVNRMAVGAKVKVYIAGKMGEETAMIGYKEISIGFGYGSGQAPIAHIGLGKTSKVDVEIILPHGNGTLTQKNVSANQTITLKKS